MKKFLIILTIAIVAVIPMTGCRTTTNPSGVVSIGGYQIDPKATADAVRVAAKLGALAAINKKNELRGHFLTASLAIDVALAKGDITPENIAACLSGITRDPIVLDNLKDAIQLYTDYFGTLVTNKLDTYSPYTVPVLIGLSQGLRQAYILTEPVIAP